LIETHRARSHLLIEPRPATEEPKRMLSQRPGQSGCITCLAPSTPILRDSNGACVNCALSASVRSRVRRNALSPRSTGGASHLPDGWSRLTPHRSRAPSPLRQDGRHATSAQCSPASAKKIADRRCKIGRRLDLQGLRERLPATAHVRSERSARPFTPWKRCVAGSSRSQVRRDQKTGRAAAARNSSQQG
jgi:hypothetical protein